MPLFEYTSFITSIDGRCLSRGVLHFFEEFRKSIYPVAASLLSMFLRKSKKLKTLSLSNYTLGSLGGKEIANALIKNNS